MKLAHLLSITTATLAPLIAQAQSAPPPTDTTAGDGNVIEAITVTATRRSSSLQSTPVAISALSGNDLAKFGIQQVDQIAQQVPNFYMQPGVANMSTVSVNMRGRGDNAGGFGTSEQPVSFYFDDIYQARPSAVNSELADVERVEVLRGPQGTLFGRNSMTGAVNVITRTPGDTPYGSISAEAGTYGTAGGKAAIGLPLVPGALAASFSAVGRNQAEGYIYDVATHQSVDKRDFLGLRSKLHFYGSDVWDIVVAGNYTINKNNGFVTSPITVDPDKPLLNNGRETATTTPQDGLTKSGGLSAHIVGTLGAVTVKSITGWSAMTDVWDVDLTGGLHDKFGQYTLGYQRKSVMAQHQWTQEFQVYGDALNKKLTWIAGLFYFYETTHQSFNDTMYDFFDTDLSTPDQYTHIPEEYYRNITNSYAGYAQLGYHFTPEFDVTVGGRYTHETKAISGFYAPPTVGDSGQYAGNSSYNAFTPKVTANWQITPSNFAYASFSKGFRAGGYTAAATNATEGDTPYGPERVTAWEIGVKNDLANHHVRLNLTGFLNDFQDVVVGKFVDGTAFSINFNGASYDVVGLEAELDIRLTDGFEFYGNGGVMHAYHFVYVPGADISLPISIPDWQGTLGTRYETKLDATKSLRVGGDWSFRQGVWGTVDREPGTLYSNISEINAEFTLTSTSGWHATLSGRNLANHYEYQNNLNFSFMGAWSRQPMPPRTIMIEIGYKF